MHTLLDLHGAIPAFIYISEGKLQEVNVLHILPIDAGVCYVIERGYLDFVQLYCHHQLGAFFVARTRDNISMRPVCPAPTDPNSGILCDQTVAPNGFHAA